MRVVDIVSVCMLGLGVSLGVGAYPLPQSLEVDASSSGYVSAHYACSPDEGAEGLDRWGAHPDFRVGSHWRSCWGSHPKFPVFFLNSFFQDPVLGYFSADIFSPLNASVSTRYLVAQDSGLKDGEIVIDPSRDGYRAAHELDVCDMYCQQQAYDKLETLRLRLEQQRLRDAERRSKDEELYRTLEAIHAEDDEDNER